MVSVDAVIVVICALFTSVVLIVNVFLFVLMMRNTPKSFANFGIVMKFHVVADIQTILAAAAVMNRTIPIDNAYVYIAHGPCTLISSTACFISYGLMTMGGCMSASALLYIVLVSFIVRLQIMRNQKPSDRSIIALLAIFSFPVPAAILVLFLSSRSEDSVMQEIVQEHLPEYALPGATVFGIVDIRSATMSASLSLMIIMIIPIYVIILLLRSKILQCLEDTSDFLSEKTRSMHAQFVKMLTLQCVIPPIVFVFTLVPLNLEHLDLVRSPIMEAMINVLACLSTLLSPLIVIIYIVPYRRALVRFIEGQEKPSFSANPESAGFLDRTTD